MAVPRVMLDMAVVVGAVLGRPGSANDRAVRVATTGEARLALSDDFLSELVRVLRDPEKERRAPSVARAFEIALDIALIGTLYRPRRLDWPSITDPKDQWTLDLAFESDADFIVIPNRHLHDAGLPFLVEVVTPAEFVLKALRTSPRPAARGP